MDAVTAWHELDPRDPPTFGWLRPPDAPEPTGRVLLLLGAFDPPTNAHVDVASAAGAAKRLPVALCVTKVLLARPAAALLTPSQRVRVLCRIAEERGWGVAGCNRGTYLEVVRAARAAGVDPVVVVGSDKIPQLADPSFYPDGAAGVDATFAEVRLLVVPRSGAPVTRGGVEILAPERVFTSDRIASTSASEVRRRVAEGRDVSDLVPAPVADALGGYTGSTGPG